jgi:hypothetical protein
MIQKMEGQVLARNLSQKSGLRLITVNDNDDCGIIITSTKKSINLQCREWGLYLIFEYKGRHITHNLIYTKILKTSVYVTIKMLEIARTSGR